MPLTQLDKLLRVVLKIDFLYGPKTVILEHLYILSSVVNQSKICNVNLLSRLNGFQ